MKTSPKGVAAIALHEGVVTRAYKDTAGVWTIGVGHTASAGKPFPKAGMTITRQEAFDILARDLGVFEPRVTKRMGRLRQTAFDGAVSFDFNTGAIHKASWPKHYLVGAMSFAEKSLKSWNKAGGRVVQGLVNRRAAEANLIFRGKYPAGIGEVVLSPPTDNPSAPDDKEAVTEYQGQLAALGYAVGPVDGIRGPKTIAAVKAFQKDHDLVVDGIVGPATRATLANALNKQPDDPGVDPERPSEPATDGWLIRFFRWLFG